MQNVKTELLNLITSLNDNEALFVLTLLKRLLGKA